MSTSTTNYGFVKPDISEASGSDEIVENMIKSERLITNLWLSTSSGRGDKSLTAIYKNTSDTARAVNTETYEQITTWDTILSNWTVLYDEGNPFSTPSLGLSAAYTTGDFEFYHEGYYKVTWNLRLQFSATTATEGFIRAALLGTDSFIARNISQGIVGSILAVPINTMTNITDIGGEQTIKLVQPERISEVSNGLVTGKNQIPYYSGATFFRYFTIGFAHNNTVSATATPLLNETYIHLEYMRGL